MRRFEFRDEKSAKFWSIDLQGKRFTVEFGKIGTAGQRQTKEFADESQARKECDRLVAEKVKKGYAEVVASAALPAPDARARKQTQPTAHDKGKKAAPLPSPPADPVPSGPPSTGSATLDGLLAAVREEPDDDTPRLVLADWLEENGVPERAELIRVQCRITAIEDRCDVPVHRGDRSASDWDDYLAARLGRHKAEYQSLLKREQKLLKSQRSNLFAGLPPEGGRKQTRDGRERDSCFVTYRPERGLVRVRLQREREHPSDMLAELEAMAELPAFAWVVEVRVVFGEQWSDMYWEQGEFERFLSHPGLRHVTCLNLDDRIGTNFDLFALAGRRDLHRLTELTCRADYEEGGQLDFDGKKLAKALPNLRRLALVGRYPKEAYLPLAKSACFPKLQWLEIGSTGDTGSYFEDEWLVLKAIADSAHLPELRRIDIGSAIRGVYGPTDVLALIRSPHLPKLECVEFNFGGGWHPRKKKDPFGGLEDLELDSPVFVRDLASTPEAARLRKLSLYSIRLTDADVGPLLTSPHLAGLEFLNVGENRLSQGVIKQLKQRFPVVDADRQEPA
jgi:uncharacterized protein (TIGR02996 family)